jgi:membrane-associated phospholipid phosphatase
MAFHISTNLEAHIEWGTNFITHLQTYKNLFLDIVMRLGSLMGYEILVMFVPILLWSGNHSLHRMGYNLIFLGLSCLWIVNALKLIYKEPRPYQRYANIQGDYSGNLEYSFPSGHSLCTLAIWMLVADHLYMRTKKRWIYYVLFAIALFVGSSRIYHGVHYPHDVIAGYFGGLILWMNFRRIKRIRWILWIGMIGYNNMYVSREDFESGIGLFASPIILLGMFLFHKDHTNGDVETVGNRPISILHLFYRVMIGCTGIGILFVFVEFTRSNLWLKMGASFFGTLWMMKLAPKVFDLINI